MADDEVVTATEPVSEDRRAPVDEQPIALAIAEEQGTLPAEDRRTLPDTLSILESAEVGSIFTKVKGGWRVEFVKPGGSILSCGGETITQALAGHGVQRTHDSYGNEHGQAPVFEVPR